jgi:hypothetical protein
VIKRSQFESARGTLDDVSEDSPVELPGRYVVPVVVSSL